MRQALEAARKPKGDAPAAKAGAKPAAVDPKKMSVADMLAAARTQDGGEGGAAPAAAAPAEPEPAAEEAAAEAAPAGDGAPRKDITDVAEQIAYCRQVDGG